MGSDTVLTAIIAALGAVVVALIGLAGVRRQNRQATSETTERPINVVTHGGNSPGIVHGNFVQITQIIRQEYRASKKKEWRELSYFVYSAQQVTRHGRAWTRNLCSAAIAAFESATTFTLLAWKTESRIEGEPIVEYHTTCAKSLFIDEQRKLRHKALSIVIRAKEMQEKGASREEVMAMVGDPPNELEGWDIQTNFSAEDIQNRHVAIECQIDPANRKLNLVRLAPGDLNPKNYGNNIGTTSQLLRYFTAVAASAQGVAVFGDIEDWVGKENYRLQKLLVSLLDKSSMSLSKILVNAHDDEDWDYENLEYDLEVERNSKQ